MGDQHQQGSGVQRTHLLPPSSGNTTLASSAASAHHPSRPGAPRLHGSRSTSSMTTLQSYQPALTSYPTPSEAWMLYNPYPLPPLPSAPSFYPSSNQAAFPTTSSNTNYPPLQFPSTSNFNGNGNGCTALGAQRNDILTSQYSSPSTLVPFLGGEAQPAQATCHSRARRTPAASGTGPNGSGNFGGRAGSGNASMSQREDHLYVSPTLIMNNPSSASQSGSASRKRSVSPTSTSGLSSKMPTRSTQSSTSALSAANDTAPNSNPVSTSPLTSRSARMTLSPGFIFDPEWELPSPVTSLEHAPGSTVHAPLRRRSSNIGQRGRLLTTSPHPSLSTATTSSMYPFSGDSAPSSAGLTTGFPSMASRPMQSQLGPLPINPLPLSSTSSHFRYTGYNAMEPAPVPGRTVYSANLARSSSMMFEPRGAANPPRPSSEPVMLDNSRILPMPPAQLGLNPLPGSGSPYFAHGASSPASNVGMPSRQASLTSAPTFSRVSSANANARSTSRSRLPSPAGLGQASFAQQPSSILSPYPSNLSTAATPMSDQGSRRGLSPRWQSSSEYTNNTSSPAQYTAGDPELAFDETQPAYSTRTRLNMQGLMHRDHVEQGYPGDWGGAFR